jgi:hypothetical protein
MITVMTTLHRDTIMMNRIQYSDDGNDDDNHGNSDATFTRRCHCCQSVLETEKFSFSAARQQTLLMNALLRLQLQDAALLPVADKKPPDNIVTACKTARLPKTPWEERLAPFS